MSSAAVVISFLTVNIHKVLQLLMMGQDNGPCRFCNGFGKMKNRLVLVTFNHFL